MGFSLRLETSPRWLPNIERLRRELEAAKMDPCKAAAEVIAEAAQGKVHVVTGALKASIQVFDNNSEVRVGSNLPYAAREELGFVGADKLGRVYNKAPHPYLRPAAYENAHLIKIAASLALNQFLKRR